MTETIKHQLNHRAIRRFSEEAVSPKILERLDQVVNRTATSVGMQSFSVIRVSDPQIRAQIAEVGGQDYIKEIPEFYIFLVDCYRNARIARSQGEYLATEADMDRFFQGWTDASLAAQNLLTAVESLGMGGNFYGCILNDAQKIIDLLELPELTFPVVGVGFGYSAQEPMLKPRMEMSLKKFENKYVLLDDYLSAIAAYDKEMQTYYDLRKADRAMDAFSLQVVDKLKNPIGRRADIINIIKNQGFDLGLEETCK